MAAFENFRPKKNLGQISTLDVKNLKKKHISYVNLKSSCNNSAFIFSDFLLFGT